MLGSARLGSFAAACGVGLAMIMAIFPVGPAAAQGTFVCPSGPGPGERQVGMTPGGGTSGVAQVPVCVRDGPPAPAPPPMRRVDQFLAAAWHPESNNAWIAAGYLDPTRARRAALDACNRAMGGGCTIASETANGAIVISRGSGGNLYASAGASKGKAERQAREYCQKQKDECEFINTAWVDNFSAPAGANVRDNGQVFGPKQGPRRLFGSVVNLNASKTPKGSWHSGLWVVGGLATEAEAREKAMAACMKDNPAGGCQPLVTMADVYVAFSTTPDQVTYYATGPSPEIAQRRVAEDCKKDKAKCRQGGWVNLAYKDNFRFDPVAEGMPWFTAQAWVKNGVDPWRTSVWSVSGVKDGEGAKRAALAACKKETKAECEVATWSFNSRVVLYAEPSGRFHTAWIYREVDPARFVQSTCAAEKITCKLVKVIDARIPAAERIEVR